MFNVSYTYRGTTYRNQLGPMTEATARRFILTLRDQGFRDITPTLA